MGGGDTDRVNPHEGRQDLHVLGTVVLPSGVLVVGDMGYFNLWSGSDPPDLDHLDVATTNSEHSSSRLSTCGWSGPDALQAARAFDRQ